MKAIENPQRDDSGPDELSKVLRAWRVEADLPPAFQHSVWQRIDREAARRQAVGSWRERVLSWIGQVSARPALATAYFALLIMVGASAGWTHGRHEATRVHEELAQRYVQTLDPYVAGSKI